MKTFKKTLSFLLSVSLFLSAFVLLGTYAENGLTVKSGGSKSSQITDENPLVEQELNEKLGQGIAEIESLREENVKHFQLPNGEYQAF